MAEIQKACTKLEQLEQGTSHIQTVWGAYTLVEIEPMWPRRGYFRTLRMNEWRMNDRENAEQQGGPQ